VHVSSPINVTLLDLTAIITSGEGHISKPFNAYNCALKYALVKHLGRFHYS
jgi:hypothetical protein